MRTPGKFLFIFFALGLFCLNCFATVIITAGTGGAGLSADKSQSGTAPAFTTLSDIVLKAGTATDIPTGPQTLTISAPTNWQFQTTGITVTGAGTVNIGTITVISNKITIVYNASAASTANAITISGVQVQATTSNISITTGNITGASNPTTITGLGTTSLGALSQVASAFVKLQTLLPGESNAPATVSGKSGTAAVPGAGSVNVVINAVDVYWNKVVTAPADNISITSSDANAGLPVNAALVSGTHTFAVILRTITAATTVTATDFTDASKTANTSSPVTVGLGAYAALVVILPGESFQGGTATGKTGPATTPTAGTAFNVTVYAVDGGNNQVSTVTESVAITSNDVNAVLPTANNLVAGTQTFSFTFRTALTGRTVTATGTKSGTSTAVTVGNAPFSKLQILLSGEIASAGSNTGKTGVPNVITAGGAITATVNAVDAYWNKVTTVTDMVTVTSTDPGATITVAGNLSSGTKAFTVTLRAPGTTTITATDADNTKTPNTSPPVTVNQGALANLLMVLPGETFAPGTATGKGTTPASVPVAGTQFNFDVYAVDAGNNVITTNTDNVAITSGDVNAVLPTAAALSSGHGIFTFNFKTAGSFKITATDATAAKTISTATLAVIPGLFSKMQILLPGEVAAPGTLSGKTGAPTARASGVGFSVIVNAVDDNWNKITAATTVNTTGFSDAFNIVSNDIAISTPFTGTLSAGTRTITVTLKTPTPIGTPNATLQANDVAAGAGSITPNLSPQFAVTVGAVAKLQILLPGQNSAPNTTTGYTGPTAGTVTAGVPYTVTVNAVDKNFNIVSTVTDQISLTITNDPNAIVPAAANLVAGTANFTVTFKTAGTARKITPIDNTTITTKISVNFSITVIPNTFAKLLAIFPGEVYAGGTTAGKTGTPNPQAAGAAFNVGVFAVDAYSNKITVANPPNPTLINDALSVTTNDPAFLPVGSGVVTNAKVLSKGAVTISITLKTPTTPGSLASLTFTDTPNPSTITPYTESSITITNGNFVKLLLLMPGESSAPGTTTGKSGTITQQTAGVPFTIRVYAVDAAWNILTTPTDKVNITSTSDPNAPVPAGVNMVGGAAMINYMFVTAGNRAAIASDGTDGTKTKSTGSTTVVVPGAFAKLLVLLPNETAKPGLLPDGKVGQANPSRTANFNITVDAVDAYFNVVTTLPSTTINLSLDDHSAGAFIISTTPNPFSGTVTLTAGTKTGIPVRVISTASSPLPNIIATDPVTSITRTEPIPLNVPASNATDLFRTLASGDWNDSSIWQSSSDGGITWHSATLVPGTTSTGITVQNGTVVNIPAIAVTVGGSGKLVVANGGQITVSPTGTLTINGSGADVDGIITNANVINGTGPLTFKSDGDYQHNFTTTPGTIPTATWDSQSTLEVIGYTGVTGTIGGGNQAFGNVIWNCPNQGTSGVALGGVTASMNSLTITSTGSSTGSFQLLTTNATTNLTVKNFTQTGGNVIMNNNTTAGTANLFVTGDFNVSGGTLSNTGTGANLISFSGTTKQNFIKTGGTFSNPVNFAIANGAIVDFDTNVLDGTSGTFNLNSGGTLITGNDFGIAATGGTTGSIQNTGTRTFNTGANYTYDGNNGATQSAGNGLPTTIANLTINNINDVALPAIPTTYTINGTLALTSGNLDVSTNNLTVPAGVTTIGTGSGFIRTQSVSTTPLPTGKTWNVGVEYYGSSAQTLVSGNYSNLSFSAAGTKTASGTITITGNWSSSGGDVDFLTNSSANAQFTGTSQTLDDSSDDGVTFGNVTFGSSGTKSMNSGNFNISPNGILTMSGTAKLAVIGNSLTILADQSGAGTGYVAAIPSNASITGNVNVQTFFTGGGQLSNRGYRLISSPVSDPSLAANTFYNLSFLQGDFSYLSGAAGGGFDGTGNPTLFLYRQDQIPAPNSFTSGNFRAITAINNAYNIGTIDGNISLPVGNGVLYFYRGNNAPGATNLPSDLVFTALGPLNQGQIKVSPWTGGSNLAYTASSGSSDPRNGILGFNLVGNPYPCSIDWNKFSSSDNTAAIYGPNVDQTIYIYNASAKNYATYGGGTGVNGGSNIIPSGQGFFVRALNSSAALTFNEAAKITSHAPTLLLNAASPALNAMHMHLQLSKDSINKDENAFVFNNDAHTGYAVNEDALYLSGSGLVSLSNLSADNKRLAINQLPLPKQKQAIPLNIAVSATGNYQFTVNEMTNIPNVYDIFLVDNYLRDSLDLKANKTYTFAVTSDTASTGANRFKLLIKPDAALAVHLLSFGAVKSTAEVKVNWTVENEVNYTQYVLQRSVDGGKTFNVLDSLTSASLGTYNDLDPHPVTGQNMYRLKQIDLLGNVTYSNIITIMYSLPGSTNIVSSRISLYPNPTANTLNVTLKASDNTAITGNYKITVTNTSGIVVKSATSAQSDWHSDVSALTPGTYFIEIINTKDNSLTGRSSFVKL